MTSSTWSTAAPAELTHDGARRYLRRRRALLALPFAVVMALVASRGVDAWRHAGVLERCEAQRAASALVVTPARTVAGLVLVKPAAIAGPVLPARGDVVVSPEGAWLVGDGRVLALDASCAKGAR